MIRVRGGEPVRLIRGIDLKPSSNEGIPSGFVPRKVLGCIHICIGSPFSKSRGICVSGKNMPTTASGLAPASSMDLWLRSRRLTRCSKQSTAHRCMESNCRRCKQLTAPAGHIFGFAPSPGSSLCKTESRTVGGSYRGKQKRVHLACTIFPHSGYGHDGRSQNWEIFTGAVQQAKKKHEGKMEVWLQADKRYRSPLSVEPAISACYTLV